jgi:6,7-dimethyl-8-ribityllumazine synthase
MPTEFRGHAQAPQSGRLAIVVSDYNASITNKLLAGALETFRDHGVTDDLIDVARVPGAWEIPVAARRLVLSKRYAAIVCLGAVIRGETTHDRYINNEVSAGLNRLALDTGVPMLFGLLTCDTLEQAIARSGGSVGNKGSECAKAALEMIDLLSSLPPEV